MPPSSTRTKSASDELVVVVGVSELPVVRTVPVASGRVIVRSAVGSVGYSGFKVVRCCAFKPKLLIALNVYVLMELDAVGCKLCDQTV